MVARKRASTLLQFSVDQLSRQFLWIPRVHRDHDKFEIANGRPVFQAMDPLSNVLRFCRQTTDCAGYVLSQMLLDLINSRLFALPSGQPTRFALKQNRSFPLDEGPVRATPLIPDHVNLFSPNLAWREAIHKFGTD